MRALSALLIAALCASVLTACVAQEPPAADVRLTTDQLAEAGILIIDDQTAVPDSTTDFMITESQAEWLITEADLGSGFVGSELDSLAPIDEGMPPTSYILASWITTTDLPGAKLSATLFPDDTDFTQAPSILFPTATVALFVSDMMQSVTDDSFEVNPQGDGPTAMNLAAVTTPRVLDTACSTLSKIFDTAINGIFDVLRVLPKVVNGIKELGFFGTVLAGILSGAISLAQDAVVGLVKSVVGPVLNTMRTVIGALGIATLVISHFTKERLDVGTGPSGNLPFGIEPAAGVPGTFTMTPKPLTKNWPKALSDCATALEVPLPEPIKSGAEASWRVTARPELITLARTTSTVSADKSSVVDFVTGTEDAETAKGTALFDASRVSVTVPNKQVGQLIDLVIEQLEDVKSSILSKIPTPLQGAVQKIFALTVDRVIASVRSSLDSVGGILSLKGHGVVYVTHHRPKEPSPSPSPSPKEEEDGAFCAEFREKVEIARADLVATDDLFAWSARFATSLDSIESTPPADLAADFGVTVGFYELAGASSFADAGALADYVTANDSDGARVRLWTACGADQFQIE